MRLYIDTETYSSVDLKKSGNFNYIKSPDFVLLLVAFAYDDEPVNVYTPENLPKSFKDSLMDPDIEKWAHNAIFEYNVFQRIGMPIPEDQLYDSLALSGLCGLPLSLDSISKALKLEELGKKAIGKQLIKLFSVPNRQGKRELPSAHPNDWEQFKEYVKYDVIAEREVVKRLSSYIPTFPSIERQVYLTDQHINLRGVEIDIPYIKSAIAMDEQIKSELSSRIASLTGITNPNSIQQCQTWLKQNNVGLESLGRPQIELFLKENPNLPENIRLFFKLRTVLGRTSTKKYQAMLDCKSSDNRVRGLFQYVGATRTARWTSRMVQLQNLPQNHLDSANLATVKSLVTSNDREALDLLYGNPTNLLAEGIRTALIPTSKPKHKFVIADYSAIEARILSWVAQEPWRINVFNTHGKIYESAASLMFGIPVEQIQKGSAIRQKGKVAELALGYAGGVTALESMDRDKSLEKNELWPIVDKWRRANPKVCQFWQTLNDAAILCVQDHVPSKVSCLELFRDSDTFQIKLPSGRSIFYWHPLVQKNRFGALGVVYKGVTMASQWDNIETYGGKLTENIVQAISRDLLADALVRMEQKGLRPVMHVHDEIICDVEEYQANDVLQIMLEIMSSPPKWMNCLPLKIAVKGDGMICDFYQK